LHFDALASGFGALGAGQPGANDQLKALIAYHIRLLSITRKINRAFNFVILINFATSTIAICVMAYSMVMFNVFMACKYSVGLVAFLILTFFICYNGDQLTSASNQLLPAAFYNNWYEGDLNYRKMMLFFIMRSCETQELRAYKFMPVSMITYMAILKFSYQLFMFLRTMA
ncbi:GH23434, partial [Drosophila grimshawi]